MPLSTKVLRRLAVALGNKAAADAIAAAIDAQGSGPAAKVTAIGTTAALPAAACAGGATPAATDVNTAINTVTAAAEARLDGVEGKVDAIIAALKGANLMTS